MWGSLCVLGVLAASGSAGAETAAIAKTCSGAPSQQEPVKWRKPQYPMRAAQREIEGWVDLAVTLRPNGGVERADVCDSTDRIFEKAALMAIRKWCYAPPTDPEPEPFTLRIGFLDGLVGEPEPYFYSPRELIVPPGIPSATSTGLMGCEMEDGSLAMVPIIPGGCDAWKNRRDPCSDPSEELPEGKREPDARRASEGR